MTMKTKIQLLQSPYPSVASQTVHRTVPAAGSVSGSVAVSISGLSEMRLTSVKVNLTRNLPAVFLLFVWVMLGSSMGHLLQAASPQSAIRSHKADPDTLIVAKDGSGDFTRIQDAIENAKAYPLNRLVIFIKNGIYEEQVRIAVWNPDISIIGEDREKTVIRFGSYFGQVNKGRNSTFYTATFSIEAKGITCRHLTIENTAGPVGQAIALSVSADQCLIEDCNISGNQDTFFATGINTHVYLQGCMVSGTTDFLFGDATVLLRHCTLLCKADSYIVAASTSKGQDFGFVLDRCTLLAAEGVKRVFLGRPWRPHAKTVYLNTIMGDFIAPIGWDNWRDKTNEATAYYAEYNSLAADKTSKLATGARANWTHQLTSQDISQYSIHHILGAWVDKRTPLVRRRQN